MTPLEQKALINSIERYAEAIQCPRHLKLIRGCTYADGAPCECRTEIEKDPPKEQPCRRCTGPGVQDYLKEAGFSTGCSNCGGTQVVCGWA